MRALRFASVGLSALLAGSLLTGCGFHPAVQRPPAAATPLVITARTRGVYAGRPPAAPWRLTAISMASQESGWAVAQAPSGLPTDILQTQNGGRSFQLRYTAAAPVVGVATPSPKDVEILESPCLSSGCGTSALVASTDGGQTFSQAQLFPGFAADAMSFPDTQDGFIAGGSSSAVSATHGTLYVTHDGGKNWSSFPWSSAPFNCPSAGIGDIALQFTSPLDGWLLCGGQPATAQQGKVLLRTTDGGAHWSTVAADTFGPTGIPSGALQIGGYVHSLFFLNQGHGYIGLDRQGFLATQDGGLSWHTAFTSAVPAGSDQAYAVGFLPGGFGWLLGGYGPILFTTEDQGANWQAMYPPAAPTNDVSLLPGGDAFGLSFLQGTPELVASNNGGASWGQGAALPAGGPLGTLQVLPGNTFILGDAGGIEISQDAGQTWSRLRLPGGYAVRDLGFLSLGLGWTVAANLQETALLRCARLRCSVLKTPFNPVAAMETGPNSGIALGMTTAGQGALFASADGGQRWTTRLLPSGMQPVGLGVTPYLWWIYSQHHILWSYDRGVSWHEISLADSYVITSLSFSNFKDGLMTTLGPHGLSTVWRTANAGRTFVAASPQ